MYVGKIKVLISSAVNAQLICTFILAYAKSKFSYGVIHISIMIIAYFRRHHNSSLNLVPMAIKNAKAVDKYSSKTI